MLLLAGGRLEADGPPSEVLSSPACARAFAVAIRPHRVPGVRHPLYSFESGGERTR